MDLIQSILIGVVSGGIVAIFSTSYKVGLERTNKLADESLNLKIKNVTDRMISMWSELNGVKSIITKLETSVELGRKEVENMKMKLEVVATEQRLLTEKVSEISSSVKDVRSKITEGFGRVIIKDKK